MNQERKRMAERARALRVACFGDSYGAVTNFARWLGINPNAWVNYEAGIRPVTYEVESKLLMKFEGFDVRWMRFGDASRMTGWIAEALGLQPRSGKSHAPFGLSGPKHARVRKGKTSPRSL